MHLLRFSTEAYPRNRRGAAWRDELRAARLHCESLCADHTLHGTIQSRTTPAGIELTCIASVPQTLAITSGDGRGLMLVMLTEGEAHLAAPELREPLRPGQVVCVPAHAARMLALATSFRMLIVHIGQALLSARITAPLPRSALVLSGDSAELFARLLQSMAASFDTIVSANAKAIQPFDNTITACLDAALADSQPIAPPDMTPSRAAVFARVCSRIDARLAEPELSLAAIAADERMSARYLQKLFEKSGSSFSAYLRTSRLERCRADLANHQYDKLSVSDICYRWGFNDPSHFSHAFREQFGLSPRAYREQTANTPEHRPPQNVSRGLPAHAKRAPASPGAPANDVPAARLQPAPTIVPITQARSHAARPEGRHHWLQATDKTVHWGYLSHDLPPCSRSCPATPSPSKH